METRPLGRTGIQVGVVGICLPEGAAAEPIRRLALERGANVLWSEGRPEAPADLVRRPEAYALVRYNLLDHAEANAVLPPLRRSGKGAVATHVLAGGALAGKVVHAPRGARVVQLGFLVRPGRTLVQGAIQFVLANDAVSCALVRVSSPDHLEEALAAPEAPPLTGRELEQVFELWGNRND